MACSQLKKGRAPACVSLECLCALLCLSSIACFPERNKNIHSLLHSVQNLALIPASAFQDDKSCWSILTSAGSDSCLEARTTSLGVRTSWCRANDTDGIVLVENLSAEARHQDVYRIRLVGTVIELLAVTYCSRHLAIAPYHLSHSGRYSVEVLHLHSGYTMTDPSPVHNQEHLVAATFKLELSADVLSGKVASQPGLCTALDSPGKWLREDPDAFSSQTCFREDYMTGCLPRDASVGLGQSGLTWWQEDCTLQHLSSSQLTGCLTAKKVCFVGDSHSRVLYNSVVDLLSDTYATIPPEGKSIRPSEIVTYHEDFWGHGTHDEHADCDVIVRNTGAWHIAWSMSAAGRAKPDLLDYAQRVQQIASMMEVARQRGAQLIWMTSNGQPISLAVHKYKKFQHKDFRTDPLLLAINRVANNIMTAHNISIFDTWSMTNPVADLSFDGIHYAGDVGYFMAMRILNSLCTAGTPHD